MPGSQRFGCAGIELLENRVLLSASPVLSAPLLFQPPAEYHALGYNSVAVGDVNGDGIPDLISRSATKLTVLLGLGGGRFGPAIETTLDSRAGDFVTGDFNHDGKLDVAYPIVPVDQPGGPPLTGILLGNGDGTFRKVTQLPIAGEAPATADFNGDGNLDLVTNNDTQTVAVALGNGDGTFRVVLVPSGGLPDSIVTGDFNGDGKPDIAMVHALSGGGGDNDVTVLLGNGDGTFSAPQKYLLPSGGPSSQILLASADLNGDGKPDLLALDWYRNEIDVLLNAGNGTFKAPVTSPAEVNSVPQSGGTSLALIDMNGDGKPDLVVNDDTNNTVTVRLGLGDGTFGPNLFFSTGEQPFSIAAVDLNGDGRPDLVVGNVADNVVTVLLSTSVIGAAAPSPQVVEGRSLNNVPLATFGSLSGPLNAGDYTALIDWGDGTVSPGVITADGSGSSAVIPENNSGELHVSGTHTYRDAGTFFARPMLRDAHGIAASAVIPVLVTDAPLSASGESVSGTLATPLTAVLAHFTDANVDTAPEELSAAIDWGNGNNSPGTILPNYSGGYIVLGTETYSAPGAYTAVVSINDGGYSTATANAAVSISAYLHGGGTISGNLYNDLSANGIRELGEPPLPAWSVFVDENNNGVADPGEPVALSDAAGIYTLADVPAGTWPVRLALPPGWRQTQPAGGAAQTVAFHTGQILNGVDFGAVHLPAVVTAASFASDRRPPTVSFTFNQPVSGFTSSGAVVVNNLSTGQVVTPTATQWDPKTFTLTLTLPTVPPDGYYDAILAQSAITDALGGHLNADPDGTGGDDYVFNFSFLAADLNQDGKVDLHDLVTLAAHYGRAGTLADGDVNGDGKIDFKDVVLLAQSYGRDLTATATQYQFIDLTPDGMDMSAGGIMAGQVAGGGKGGAVGGSYHALLFHGPSQSVTDLNPTGYTMSSTSGIFGPEQVGYGSKTNTWDGAHALLWNSTAASAVDLNPAGAAASEATGIFGNQQVGYDYLLLPKARYHGLLWYGTAGSVVDLNPVGFNTTFVDATSGDHQVGTGYSPTASGHAMLWAGTAASVIDLNPAGYTQSDGRGVWGDQQVGNAWVAGLNNVFHAILWHGTAASAVDLNPAGAAFSEAHATNGREQVGEAGFGPGGVAHAIRWTGSAASALDLQQFLPASLTTSVATAIDADGDILGSASDGIRMHLVEWVPITSPVSPAPAEVSPPAVATRRQQPKLPT